MGIKYVGSVSDRVYGRQKRQNVTRWMYVPRPKYKPTFEEVAWAIAGIIAVIDIIIIFVVWLMNR